MEAAAAPFEAFRLQEALAENQLLGQLVSDLQVGEQPPARRCVLC